MLQQNQPVVIIGGGVVGLSLARELAKRDRHVVLLERSELASGSSSAALGVLSAPTPNKLSAYSRLCRAGYERHVELAAELLEEVGVDVGYQECGSIRLFDAMPPKADKSLESWRAAGVTPRWIEYDEICQIIPQYGGAPRLALSLDREAVVDPGQVIRGLKESCELKGVDLRENQGELRLNLDADRPRIVDAQGEGLEGIDRDAAIVVACGAWSSRLVDRFPTPRPRVDPIRGQAFRVDHVPPKCIVHTGATTRNHYALPQRGGQLWFGSTVEDVGFEEVSCSKGRDSLLDALRILYPTLEDGDIVESWFGFRPKAMRLGGPYLCPWPGIDNLWLSCGHFKSGVLTGPPSAVWLCEHLVDGKPLPPDFLLPGTHG